LRGTGGDGLFYCFAFTESLPGQSSEVTQDQEAQVENARRVLPADLRNDTSVKDRLLSLFALSGLGDEARKEFTESWNVREGVTGGLGIVGFSRSGTSSTYLVGSANVDSQEANSLQEDFEAAHGETVMFLAIILGRTKVDVNIRGATLVCTLRFEAGELISLDWAE